jgi:phosphatidylinositol-3-phosphatase
MTSIARLTTWLVLSLTGILVVLALGACGATGRQSVVVNLSAAVPAFKHVFVIVLENKAYDQIIGDNRASYLNTLAHQYALAHNYYGIRHPSLPNYLAMTGGDTFGVKIDCIDCFVDAPNLVDQLEGAGRSWKAYMESMPSPCFVGDAAPLYRQKHNPFIYYDNVRMDPARCAKIVPFTQLKTDLEANALPDFVWMTPNMCNDAHDCPVSTADAWLKTWVSAIMASPAWRDDGALFITFDEGPSSDTSGCCQYARGGRIATLVVSPLARAGYRSEVAYDHYSLLRTIESAWGLPPLANVGCDCSPIMADFFQPAAP